MIKWECDCCGKKGKIRSTDSSEEIGAIDPSEYHELIEQNNLHFVGDQLWCGDCFKKGICSCGNEKPFEVDECLDCYTRRKRTK